jgi:hypothetical protein
MNTPQSDGRDDTKSADHAAVTGSNRRTLDAISRHPVAHNLEWSDVISLFEKLGTVERKANSEFVFQIGPERHLMRRPHSKDLTASEVVELRHFLSRTRWSPEAKAEPVADAAPAAPNLMVVVDHHGAKIYHVDVASDDASKHTIRPYDPHHFLHHLVHKDQSREEGQRAAEDSSFYERIAQALAAGGKLVVVGHGKGKSNAAHHLTEYLRSHHREIHDRIVFEATADLSSVTPPQLLEMVRDAMR